MTNQFVIPSPAETDSKVILTPQDIAELAQIASNDPPLALFIREKLGRDFSTPIPNGGWTPYSLDDAYKENQPLNYLVPGILTAPSLNIIYGAPGALKSFFAADLIVCVAAGHEWLLPEDSASPIQGIPTKQVPVMWVDFDNGVRRTHERFGALGRARNLSPDIALTYYSMPNPHLNGRERASIGELIRRMNDAGVKLVVIDNLGYVSGNSEENSSEMVQVMAHFRELSEETQSAVILIHHQRKSNGYSSRLGESLRGHSSIEGALDLALLIERQEGTDSIKIRSTKDRGEKVSPLGAQFIYENDTAGRLYTAKFVGVNIVTEKARRDDPVIQRIDTVIRDELSNAEELNKTSLIYKVKEKLKDVGDNKIRRRIDELAEEGSIGQKDGLRPNEKIFTTPK